MSNSIENSIFSKNKPSFEILTRKYNDLAIQKSPYRPPAFNDILNIHWENIKGRENPLAP